MKKQIALAACFAASAVFADKVYLKSGSFLSGTAGVIQNNVLKFTSDDLGDVSIKVENIAKIESERLHVVQHNDNSSEEVALTVKDGAYYVADKKLDMSTVKATDPAVETWHGSVNGAFNAARGNTVENSWSILANVNRRWEKDRFNANFGYYYSEKGTATTDTTKSTDRWEAEAQHDHFWFPSVYNYENVRYDRDRIQELNMRIRLGAGLGYQWLEKRMFESTGKWSFNQELGVNWVKEEYAIPSDAKENGYAALRYAHHLNYLPKWNEGLELFHNLEYLPEVDDWEKYLAKADIGFTTKLIYDFDLIAKIEWEFNSKPAANRKKEDVRYIVGLGYKW